MVIEFYVPARHKRNTKWTPLSNRGRLLEFPKKETPEEFMNRLRATIARARESQSSS